MGQVIVYVLYTLRNVLQALLFFPLTGSVSVTGAWKGDT